MSTLHSSAAVAAKLGKDKSTICRRAKQLGIGQLVGVSRVFTDADIERLAANIQDGPGNPNCGENNYFMGTKKRPRKRKKTLEKPGKK